tara:strand:- start:485 stop:1801 length:1317 start_codon:yes stop_codon:yes gene_type:complete
MATEAYDVVRSLRELLQSQERRDKDRVQTALQAMQFSQAKKMQDVQLAGQQIQFLQTVNTQQMKSIAATFINNTGFGRLYSPTEDEEERTNAVEDAYDKLTEASNINTKTGENTGGYGFSGEDANRIVAAMWAHKAGSHDEILSIADELNTKLSTKGLGASDKKFVEAFVSGGYLSQSEYEYGFQESGELKSAGKVVQNTKDIVAEMYEYGKGDFEIQRDIGEYKEPPMDWDTLSEEFTKKGQITERLGSDITPQVSELKQLSTSISKKQSDKSLIELELDNLKELSQANLINDEQSQRLESIPLQIETFDEDIADLSERINIRRKDLSVSSALVAKQQLQKTQTETGMKWASEVDIKELSELLAEYDPSVLEDVVAGKPSSIFWESMSYGGKLEGAPMGTKFKLWNLAKKIEESKTMGDIKSGAQNFTEKFNKPVWK